MQQLAKWRQWTAENQGWQLICDIEDADSLYQQWHELPKAERMSWIGKYGSAAKRAWEEFGSPKCKVNSGVLDAKCHLHPLTDWPHGPAMSVYKTS